MRPYSTAAFLAVVLLAEGIDAQKLRSTGGKGMVGVEMTAQSTSSVKMVPGNGKAAEGAGEKRQYRGVNLGGWLLIESWMYPNFYKTLGIETWLGEMQVVDALGGKEKARPFLEEHWDTWVTKQDLQNLKDGGITHIRIPIGYWILGEEFLKPGETYLPGAWPYLLRSLKWCKELGLKAIVDLHGAPGVQNGHDNGGFEGGNESIMWGEPENQKRTTDVLVYLAKNLTVVNATAGYEGSLQGLCLLNEPWTTTVGGPLSMQLVKDWVQEATDAVLAAGWKGDIWFPDGFDLTWKGWEGFLQPPQYHNIYADSHLYMLFDPALWKLGAKAQTNNICQGYTTTQLEKVKGKIASGVVIGEYSLDFLTFPDFPYDAETEKNLQNLLLAEQKMYGVIGNADNAAVGAFFWSFKSLGRVKDDLTKLEDNPHSPWSYLSLLKDGIASKDLAKAEFNCTAFIAGYANQPPPAATPGVTTAGGPSGGAVQ